MNLSTATQQEARTEKSEESRGGLGNLIQLEAVDSKKLVVDQPSGRSAQRLKTNGNVTTSRGKVGAESAGWPPPPVSAPEEGFPPGVLSD